MRQVLVPNQNKIRNIRRGRIQHRWLDLIKKVDRTEIMEEVDNRDRWRVLVKDKRRSYLK